MGDLLDETGQETVARVTAALKGAPRPVAIRGARKVDAHGERRGYWVVADARGVIVACGSDDDPSNDGSPNDNANDCDPAENSTGRTPRTENNSNIIGTDTDTDTSEYNSPRAEDTPFRRACRMVGIDPNSPTPGAIIDARGLILTPGFVDIHSHGAWGASFDDGPDGIDTARAGHAMHGTTRQVLSLVTNPMDVMLRNIRIVRAAMDYGRPDILGCHLEGPFLAPERKGAHASEHLRNPTPELIDALLDAAGGDRGTVDTDATADTTVDTDVTDTTTDPSTTSSDAPTVLAANRPGCIRQITIAPELPHALDTISRLHAAGIVPAIGHTDADYTTAKAAFAAGAGIMTHMFNAMNGLHHRNPGPIPAAIENPHVIIELIDDGFHVDDSMVRLGFTLAPHRIALVTDAMAATGRPDGVYRLGGLDVSVVAGRARLADGGAIAGSTLTMEAAVRRAIVALGFGPVDAVEAATLTPARAFGFDRPNPITGAPLGLISPGYAADFNLIDATDWTVRRTWCAGRRVR